MRKDLQNNVVSDASRIWVFFPFLSCFIEDTEEGQSGVDLWNSCFAVLVRSQMEGHPPQVLNLITRAMWNTNLFMWTHTPIHDGDTNQWPNQRGPSLLSWIWNYSTRCRSCSYSQVYRPTQPVSVVEPWLAATETGQLSFRDVCSIALLLNILARDNSAGTSVSPLTKLKWQQISKTYTTFSALQPVSNVCSQSQGRFCCLFLAKCEKIPPPYWSVLCCVVHIWRHETTLDTS